MWPRLCSARTRLTGAGVTLALMLIAGEPPRRAWVNNSQSAEEHNAISAFGAGLALC